METAECGAAALGMVLGYFRRFVPLDELRQACGVSRDGARASSIVRAARGYGLEVRGIEVAADEIESVRLPFIAFWSNNHFVVVEGRAHGGIRINDPVSGRRVVGLRTLPSSIRASPSNSPAVPISSRAAGRRDCCARCSDGRRAPVRPWR